MNAVVIPSWLRWPPNCCETCISWSSLPDERWVGRCSASGVNGGDKTDARFRCQDFQRKPEAA